MHRDLREVLASQDKMLMSRAEPTSPDAAALERQFEDHLRDVERMLRSRPCFEALDVSYNHAVADPTGEAAHVNRFLGGRLDVQAMAAAINPALYRTRG
jgi:hypothetical protein